MFSDTNLLFTSLWPTVLFCLSVALVILEYTIKPRGVLFTIIDAVFFGGAALILLASGCSLCDILVLVLSNLVLRLFFEIRVGRAGK